MNYIGSISFWNLLKSVVLLKDYFPLQNAVETDNETKCEMCQKIFDNVKEEGQNKNETAAKEEVLNAAASSGYDIKDYVTEARCHWKKYYYDAKFNTNSTSLQTCADLGNCPSEYQSRITSSFPYIDITNETKPDQYRSVCFVPEVILVHHTVSPTADATISDLNRQGLSVQYIVARNGTIYQQVYDFNAAFHAGRGNWRNISNGRDMNNHCVGIEIVNSGAEPFPEDQMSSVMELVSFLKNKWAVDEHNIIGHYDITPDRKNDPSGYFSWQQLYSYLGIFPDLFDSDMDEETMHEVLLAKDNYTSEEVSRISEDLSNYGYMYLNTSTEFDNNFALNVQAFNRHFCPEIFIKETVENDQTVYKTPNQQWYKISEERLEKLLSTMKNETCY